METALNQTFSFEISVLHMYKGIGYHYFSNKTKLLITNQIHYQKHNSPVVIVLHKVIDAVKSLPQEPETEGRYFNALLSVYRELFLFRVHFLINYKNF